MAPGALQRLLAQEASELFDKTNLQSPNTYRYPLRALLEALANTLAHRDYASDDLVLRSGRIPVARCLAYRSDDRADATRQGAAEMAQPDARLDLIRLGLAQGEGQGLSTIRRELKSHGCPPPRYEADAARVVCTLRAHPLASKAEIRSLRQR